MATGKKIIILGTGGNCIDILDTINDINRAGKSNKFQCLGFLDDDKSKWGKVFGGAKVLGPLESAKKYKQAFFVNGIGSPSNFWRKEDIISRTGIGLDRFASIIHPTASVSKMAKLGYGTIIFQNVTITNNALIGNHVIILPNTVISHDDIVGDYTCITGGVCISGNVNIGQSCYLGAGCSIINDVNIGEYSMIGMGSVVLHDVKPNSIMVGNPAKWLRNTKPEKTR